MQPHYRDPLPLGEPDGLPYSKGVMARALVAAGVAHRVGLRARDAARARPGRAGEPRGRARAARGGRRRGARRGRGRRRSFSACGALAALRRSTCRSSCWSAARPARQVDGRDRGGPPARDHPRHLDRLHPPDDPRVLPADADAVRPLLELRGRRRRAASIEAGFLEQTRNVLVGVEASIERALDRGLVDGDRGRPPRAGAGADRDRGRARSSTPCFGSRAPRSTAATSSSATRATGGVRALEKYLDRLDEIRPLQDCIVERPSATACR